MDQKNKLNIADRIDGLKKKIKNLQEVKQKSHSFLLNLERTSEINQIADSNEKERAFSIIEECNKRLFELNREISFLDPIKIKKDFTNKIRVVSFLFLISLLFISYLFFSPINFNSEILTGAVSGSMDFASSNSCGALMSDTQLNSDVESAGMCFVIVRDGITLDCNGHTITYGGDSGFGAGIYVPGNDHIVIKNCNIQEMDIVDDGSVNHVGVYVKGDSINITLTNNTINTASAYMMGAFFNYSSDINIVNNTFNTSGQYTTGLFMRHSNNSLIENNTFKQIGANTNAFGLNLNNSRGINVSYNSINSTCSCSPLYLNDNHNSLIQYNDVSINSSEGSQFSLAAIDIGAGSANNTLLNNNFTVSGSAKGNASISDWTYSTYGGTPGSPNYLIYNNSYGEIRWVDVSLSKGEAYPLDGFWVNDSIGLGTNLHIGENIAAVNVDVFYNGNNNGLNHSANITLYGLSLDSVDSIIEDPVFRTSSEEINGADCMSSGKCIKLGYSVEAGILVFNTTGFSSFSGDGNHKPTHSQPILNATDNPDNTTIANLTLYNVSTADSDGDLVKNIINWKINGSSIAVLNMPFEKINGTNTYNAWDYSGYGNNGTEEGGVIWNATGGFDGQGAYMFNDSAGHINMGVDASLSLANNFTISAWINAKSSGPDDYQTIINQENTWRDRNYWLTLWTDGTLHLRFSSSSDTTDCDVADNQDLRDNKWHHVVGSYDGVNCMVYLDGNLEGSDIVTNNPETGGWKTYIGTQIAEDGRGFDGHIDEVMIFNRSLSPEQVNALYNNRTDLIVNNETEVGDIWRACIIPNDGEEDGEISCSNNLTILSGSDNSLPSEPDLNYPLNNSEITNRTPSVIWNNSVDNDGDILTYQILVDDNPTFNNPEINASSIENSTLINTTYGLTTILDVDTTYFWKVRANDSEGYGDFSGVFNFTLQSYLAVSITTDLVEFGEMYGTQTNNTTDDSPSPFLVENVGNVVTNATVTATPYFLDVSFPSLYYQFKIRENKSDSFNTTISKVDWVNMTNVSSEQHVVDLSWKPYKNNFLTDLLILIPSNESAGIKNSTVTFTIES